MSQSADELGLECLLHGVDTWEGEKHAGHYDDSVWNDVSSYARTHYPDRVKLHRCFFDDALKSFADGSVDLLHIDGLHTFDAVKHDFETWLPKLSRRGIVLFHDIAEQREDFGVYILWDELKQRYPHVDFHHSHGLGVLFVGPDTQATYESLSAAGEFSPLAYFELAGKVLMAEVTAPTVGVGAGRDLTTQAVLYLSAETPPVFCEERSLKAAVSLEGLSSLHWSLPDASMALRFDPSIGPSSIEIRRFEVRGAQGVTLWQLQDASDIEALQDLFTLDQGQHSGVLLHLVCTGDDPQFRLRLPAELLPLPVGTEVIVEFQAHPMDSPMALAAIHQSHDAYKHLQSQLQAECVLLRQGQTVLQAQSDAFQAQCNALKESVTDLERLNARLELESQTASHQLSHARQLRGFRLLRFVNPKTF